mgnify:CR=1 FL=1
MTYQMTSEQQGIRDAILRICEDYDNLTYSEECRYSPAVALTYMSGLVGREYDPILFQLFLNQGTACQRHAQACTRGGNRHIHPVKGVVFRYLAHL